MSVVHAWLPHTSYSVNSVVSYQGTTYQCAIGHVSGATFEVQFWTVSSPVVIAAGHSAQVPARSTGTTSVRTKALGSALIASAALSPLPETKGKEGPSVKFRYMCARHRAYFIKLLRAAGVTDRETMERIRRKALSAMMSAYPAVYIEFEERKTCSLCLFEKMGPRCFEWGESAVIAIARGEPVPPPVHKSWTD